MQTAFVYFTPQFSNVLKKNYKQNLITNCKKKKGDYGKEFTQLLQLHNIHLKKAFMSFEVRVFCQF